MDPDTPALNELAAAIRDEQVAFDARIVAAILLRIARKRLWSHDSADFFHQLTLDLLQPLNPPTDQAP